MVSKIETGKPAYLSRRHFILYSTATVATAATITQTMLSKPALAQVKGPLENTTSPKPLKAVQSILALLDQYPLVALSEAHQLQEEHDFIDTLLHDPRLPYAINAIVVEFGNALYQNIADDFVSGKPVANKDLRQIWRNTVITGGNPVWDAPVYEQFFRNVRAINHSLPPEKHIRVLLGDPPIDWTTVQSIDNYAQFATQRDAHYASVVEQEILQKGLRALLIAGNGHFLRGLRTEGDPRQPSSTWPFNAGTLLNQKYPGKLFIINILMLAPTEQDRVSQLVAHWDAPDIAHIANTWLGDEPVPASDRNAATTQSAMSDAIIYFGGTDALTASRADPSLYQGGDYAAELLRRGNLLVQWGVQQGNPLETDLYIAQLGPSYYAY